MSPRIMDRIMLTKQDLQRVRSFPRQLYSLVSFLDAFQIGTGFRSRRIRQSAASRYRLFSRGVPGFAVNREESGRDRHARQRGCWMVRTRLGRVWGSD